MQKENTHRLLLHRIKEVMPVCTDKSLFLTPIKSNNITPLSNYSILVGMDGNISDILPAEEMQQKITNGEVTPQTTLNCNENVAMPGLVDAHTHALFAGDRSRQFQMKLTGKTYVDIYNQGLGIRYTTQQINLSSEEALLGHLDKYIPRMSRLGTTTVEIKSGYGLNAQAQVKMLRVIHQAALKYKHQMTVISTFCGAHAIPKGITEQEQTDVVIHKMIPAVKQSLLAGEISPTFIDVFCQRKFFQIQCSKKIMEAGKEIGLIPSFHGDQLSNLQSGKLAAEVKARAVSHLQYVSEESVMAMSKNGVAAVLLPTTQNIEKLPLPPIAKMRQHQTIMALGSDFCPNAYCYSMPMVMHLACTNYRLTPKQSIVAATLNSAYALNQSHQIGSLQVGKHADIILLSANSYRDVIYHWGDSIVSKVIKNGVILQ